MQICVTKGGGGCACLINECMILFRLALRVNLIFNLPPQNRKAFFLGY